MHLELQLRVPLIVLTIVDLCFSIPNFADHTDKTHNTFDLNRRPNVIDAKDGIHSFNDSSGGGGSGESNAIHQNNSPLNFVITNVLSDGEIERRIQFNSITAKETLVSKSGRRLSYRQISRGDIFIQIIYANNGEILDCDTLTGQNFNEEFVKKFYGEIEKMRYTKRHIDGLSDSVHMPKFRHHTRNHMPQIDKTMDSDDELSGAINITYHQVDSEMDIPSDLRGMMNFNAIKDECDSYHQKVMQLADHNDNIVQNMTGRSNRKKRALSDWLIAPNTKWCGRGQTADKYSELGGASKADKCCRRHDHCKFNIYGMTTKWRLFNYLPFTISHCSCDARFRTCLKMADSADATMVGKLFFNVVQTKCFVLKPEKFCQKHSWWGTCEVEGVRKRAYMRTNKKF